MHDRVSSVTTNEEEEYAEEAPSPAKKSARKRKSKDFDFGKYCKQLRAEVGLSLRKVAALTVVSPQYISLIERNVRPPSRKWLLKLGAIYKMDPNPWLARFNLMPDGISRAMLLNPKWMKLVSRMSKMEEDDADYICRCARDLYLARKKENKLLTADGIRR